MPDKIVWSERMVAWYQRANARSDYARQVLSAAAGALDGCGSALDVGAGFGALALPLARRLPQVTALEPAPVMTAALYQSAAFAGVSNISVVRAAWGETTVPPHDLVVCAHVGPLLSAGATFFSGLCGVARRAVIVVCETGGGDDKFYYSTLYPRLLGRPYRERRACRGEGARRWPP
jgi:hypothetical protein